MKTRTRVYLLAIMAVTTALGRPLDAQRPPSDLATLRSTLERRFEVLPLRDGVALRPREAFGDIRSIEITSGVIAIDGQAVTGAELRQRLGSDADPIIEVSYLSEGDRRGLATARAPESRPELRERRDADADRRVAERVARRIRERRSDDRVRVGGSQTVREGEVVDGDVVTIGGSVTIDGEVHGDAVAIGGRMTLGPHAYVTQDAVVVGGGMRRDPGARIDGRVTEVGLGNLNFGDLDFQGAPWALFGSTMGSVVELVGTFTRFAILCLLSALVLLLGRQIVERTAARVSSEPLKAGAIGFLAEMLFLPVLIITTVVLVITIIGIPLILLMPFLVLGLMIVALIGFTSVTYRLGGVVAARMGWAVGNPYATTMLGILVVMAPILLTRLIGLAGGILVPMTVGLWIVARIVEWVAWTVGLGAVALARFNRSSSSMAPAIPS
jgi:hypothetical protein